MATEKQTTFMEQLLRERSLTPEVRTRLRGRLDAQDLDKFTAGKTIDWLLKQPRLQTDSRFVWKGQDVRPNPVAARAVQSGNESVVPEGRYAIEMDGTLKFYVVDKPKDGKWAGRTFVGVQASDDKYPVKDYAKRTDILARIAVDVKQAMLRYGKELGHCGHCGRTLTDETSRELGIGPICRAKLEW